MNTRDLRTPTLQQPHPAASTLDASADANATSNATASTPAHRNGHGSTAMNPLTALPTSPPPRAARKLRAVIASTLLFLGLAAVAAGLVAWKEALVQQSEAAAAGQPEPMEMVEVDLAAERAHRNTTTAIGTVLALRSITLRTELSGTVREARLVPGEIVEAGALLVALDVSVEEAELGAHLARAELARTQLERLERAVQSRGAAQSDVDRARAERDMALAEVARTRAVLEKKTIRAPFKARVGMADVHPGQFLNEGTQLTTLQGVEEAVHVDFSVPQAAAAGLRAGDRLEVIPGGGQAVLEATIAAIDARVDPATRNALVRARIESGGPAPGSSVRVRVPVGQVATAVAVPASALRKGPAGDHVFVVAPDTDGKPRAHVRRVKSGALLGDEVLIVEGLAAGEQVATTGSFKLRESVLVAVAPSADAPR